jgi:hypothetical protein
MLEQHLYMFTDGYVDQFGGANNNEKYLCQNVLLNCLPKISNIRHARTVSCNISSL